MLLDRADVALYRSKSGGRNRTTLFDEILHQCGQVLEHDIATGVIAIDIGSKVGVLRGQEFRVFPPTFCGKTAFTIDDGRSRKTLGFYPKIELCRIVVFNTQPDMSFARIPSPSSLITQIMQGAKLEAVPLGNISHLLERQGVYGDTLFDDGTRHVFGGNELQETIEKITPK